MRTSGGRTGDVLAGLLLPLRGAAALFTDVPLLTLAALPMALTAVAALASAVWAFTAGDRLMALVWARPVPCTDCGAQAWVFTRLESLAWSAGYFTASALLIALVGLVASRVLAAPAMDALSRRAMRLFGAKPDPGVEAHGDRPLLPALLVSLWRALGRTAVLVAGGLAIAAIGLVPGGAVVSTPLAFAWASAWLFADNVLYALQWVGPARMVDVRELVQARPGLCAGFALATSLLMLIPLAGLLVTPAAVSGACRLVARIRAERAPEIAPAAIVP